MIIVADRYTGTFIEEVGSYAEGIERIKEFEDEDIIEGTYEEDFYTLVDEFHVEIKG